MKKTAQEVYELLNRQKIKNYEGDITLNLMNISAPLKDKNAIGYIFQEWLSVWMKKNKIDFRVNDNSQNFPDFYLDTKNDKKCLLEIKTFDFDRSPNFDVANFEAYIRSLTTKAHRLDADYLIFGYTFSDGVLKIKEIWLKKIWEITCPSDKYPIKTQIKQGMIYNIRPAVWYSQRPQFKPFKNKKYFIKAVFKTMKKYRKTKKDATKWFEDVRNNYLEFSGEDLAL